MQLSPEQAASAVDEQGAESRSKVANVYKYVENGLPVVAISKQLGDLP